MKHIIKIANLENLPETRPLIAMDNNGNLGWRPSESGPIIELVDLGLPSGTLWAKTNVGAQSETDYGLYFAWGELEQKAGWDGQGTKVPYNWANYRFGNKGSITKYNSSDGLRILQPEDDIVTITYGLNYNIPTRELFEELLSYTDNNWEIDFNNSGINGWKFTSTLDSTKYIFLPFAGFYYSIYFSGASTNGVYLTSTCPGNINLECFFKVYYDEDEGESEIEIQFGDRCEGYTIRPVYKTN